MRGGVAFRGPGQRVSPVALVASGRVAACGAWNIHFDYKQFVWNRNLLRNCERRLQLYDKDAYGQGTVLPEAWKAADYQFKQCLPHYLQWLFVIAVVAAYGLYALITA